MFVAECSAVPGLGVVGKSVSDARSHLAYILSECEEARKVKGKLVGEYELTIKGHHTVWTAV